MHRTCIEHKTCKFKIISLQGYFCRYALRYMKPCFTNFLSGEGGFWSFSSRSKLFLELYWSGSGRSINLLVAGGRGLGTEGIRTAMFVFR